MNRTQNVGIEPKADILTTLETAVWLGIDEQNLRKHIRLGDFPACKVFSDWRVQKAEVKEWLLKNGNRVNFQKEGG